MSKLFLSDTYTPTEIERNIFHELARPLNQNGHPFLYPTLATVANFAPQQRTLVLRKVHSRTKKLWFYTDVRSAKVEELAQEAQASLHFYHPRKKLQLRLNGPIEVLSEGPLWQEAFNKIPTKRYSDYGTKTAPGTILKEVPKSYTTDAELAEKNFSLLVFSTAELEALQLNGNRHFRIAFNYTQDSWESTWLQP